MLSNHAYYSQILLKIFLVHRQNISFSMCAHALNGGPRIIITFSRREGFKASLLFQHNSLKLLNAYYFQNYASIMCQGLITISCTVCSNSNGSV